MIRRGQPAFLSSYPLIDPADRSRPNIYPSMRTWLRMVEKPEEANAEAWPAGRVHSVATDCFREAQLQGPLFGGEPGKAAGKSRPGGDCRRAELATPKRSARSVRRRPNEPLGRSHQATSSPAQVLNRSVPPWLIVADPPSVSGSPVDRCTCKPLVARARRRGHEFDEVCRHAFVCSSQMWSRLMRPERRRLRDAAVAAAVRQRTCSATAKPETRSPGRADR